jgi:hypothetical protein
MSAPAARQAGCYAAPAGDQTGERHSGYQEPALPGGGWLAVPRGNQGRIQHGLTGTHDQRFRKQRAGVASPAGILRLMDRGSRADTDRCHVGERVDKEHCSSS